jgi:Protein of unknown function (DUF3995)
VTPSRIFAVAAGVVGGLFAAISVYWGLGGGWLLDTVDDSPAATSSTAAHAALWLSVIAKLVAVILPWLAVTVPSARPRRRLLRRLGWVEAIVLVGYGGVLTSVGLLVQLDIVPVGVNADERALRWHAYLWDPWFLIWGLLVATALLTGRAPAPVPQTSP